MQDWREIESTGGKCLRCKDRRSEAVPMQMGKSEIRLRWRLLQLSQDLGAKTTSGTVDWLTVPASLGRTGGRGMARVTSMVLRNQRLLVPASLPPR